MKINFSLSPIFSSNNYFYFQFIREKRERERERNLVKKNK